MSRQNRDDMIRKRKWYLLSDNVIESEWGPATASVARDNIMDFTGFWKTAQGFKAEVCKPFGNLWVGFVDIPTYQVGKNEFIVRILTMWDENGNHINNPDLNLVKGIRSYLAEGLKKSTVPPSVDQSFS